MIMAYFEELLQHSRGGGLRQWRSSIRLVFRATFESGTSRMEWETSTIWPNLLGQKNSESGYRAHLYYVDRTGREMFSVPQGTWDSKTMEKKLKEMCGVRRDLTLRLSRSVRGGNPCRITNCYSDHQNVPGVPFISVLLCNYHIEGSLGGFFFFGGGGVSNKNKLCLLASSYLCVVFSGCNASYRPNGF